jgi:hypothetical protein
MEAVFFVHCTALFEAGEGSALKVGRAEQGQIFMKDIAALAA